MSERIHPLIIRAATIGVDEPQRARRDLEAQAGAIVALLAEGAAKAAGSPVALGAIHAELAALLAATQEALETLRVRRAAHEQYGRGKYSYVIAEGRAVPMGSRFD